MFLPQCLSVSICLQNLVVKDANKTYWEWECDKTYWEWEWNKTYWEYLPGLQFGWQSVQCIIISTMALTKTVYIIYYMDIVFEDIII